jgi:hypothetical protein
MLLGDLRWSNFETDEIEILCGHDENGTDSISPMKFQVHYWNINNTRHFDYVILLEYVLVQTKISNSDHQRGNKDKIIR